MNDKRRNGPNHDVIARLEHVRNLMLSYYDVDFIGEPRTVAQLAEETVQHLNQAIVDNRSDPLKKDRAQLPLSNTKSLIFARSLMHEIVESFNKQGAPVDDTINKANAELLGILNEQAKLKSQRITSRAAKSTPLRKNDALLKLHSVHVQAVELDVMIKERLTGNDPTYDYMHAILHPLDELMSVLEDARRHLNEVKPSHRKEGPVLLDKVYLAKFKEDIRGILAEFEDMFAPRSEEAKLARKLCNRLDTFILAQDGIWQVRDAEPGAVVDILTATPSCKKTQPYRYLIK